MARHDSDTNLPARFEALAQIMQPQAIATDARYADTIAMIDRLMAHGTLSKGQSLYLETLVQLLQAYEAKHVAVDQVRGVDAIRHLLEENQMSAADLSRLLGVHTSMGSKILKGERALTVTHIVTLSKRFAVRPELFIDERKHSSRRAS